MKSADEIFPGRQIHAGFAAHAAVDLRQERCGHLNEINATHPHACRKACHVTDHAATKSHDVALAVESGVHSCRENLFDVVQILEAFPVRKRHDCNRQVRLRLADTLKCGPLVERPNGGISHQKHACRLQSFELFSEQR